VIWLFCEKSTALYGSNDSQGILMNCRYPKLMALFFVYVSLSAPAYAYLDAATGSMILQAMIGVAATWLMYSRMFAARVREGFSRLFRRGTVENSE
jgi:hypothetical protein